MDVVGTVREVAVPGLHRAWDGGSVAHQVSRSMDTTQTVSHLCVKTLACHTDQVTE